MRKRDAGGKKTSRHAPGAECVQSEGLWKAGLVARSHLASLMLGEREIVGVGSQERIYAPVAAFNRFTSAIDVLLRTGEIRSVWLMKASIGWKVVSLASTTGGITTQSSTTTTTTTPVDAGALESTCDVYCQGLNGGASYCKFDQNPPTCQGGDQTCGTIAICGPPVTVTPTQAVPTGDGTYEPACDTMCQSLNDEASYCKWWLPKPTCLGGDQPCGDQTVCTSQTWPPAPTPSLPAGAHPHESAPCNAYCVGLNGPASFCKWWKDEPACQGGDQPCGSSDCASGTPAPTEGPPDSHAGPSPNCDAYCTSVNPGLSGDRVSYCKWWLYVPVCYDGDQPCGPSVCSNFGETTTPTPTTATPTTQAATTAAPTTQAATTAAPTV
ncbi:hypothetical protein FOZ60_009244 [Perkinsus olseni]|uniref:Uncharacterized protein n=1 Tax=Perkinsus olseni TaxID=32597 RepID=A0A7J6NHQ1_PEROL|nr:hypothetical protein FOZ60_009244 [Perkinsus olseni]